MLLHNFRASRFRIPFAQVRRKEEGMEEAAHSEVMEQRVEVLK